MAPGEVSSATTVWIARPPLVTTSMSLMAPQTMAERPVRDVGEPGMRKGAYMATNGTYAPPLGVCRSKSASAHGLDCACSNCARVGGKELGLLAAIDALEKDKAEVSAESRVDSHEGSCTV